MRDSRKYFKQIRRMRQHLKSLNATATVDCMGKTHTIGYKNGSIFIPHDNEEFVLDKALRRLGSKEIKAFRCHNFLLQWRAPKNQWGMSRTDYRSIPEKLRPIRKHGETLRSLRLWAYDHNEQPWPEAEDPTERLRVRTERVVTILAKKYNTKLRYGLIPKKDGGYRKRRRFDVELGETPSYHDSDPQTVTAYYKGRYHVTVSLVASHLIKTHSLGITVVNGLLVARVYRRVRRKTPTYSVLAYEEGTEKENIWGSGGTLVPTGRKIPALLPRKARVTQKDGKWQLTWGPGGDE